MTSNGQSKHHFAKGYISKGGGNESFDVSDGSTPKYLSDGQKAFIVHVHANKDGFNPGKKLVVSNKTKTFDHFLNECTDKLKPSFGAAFRLHTPRHGRRVHDLNELRKDDVYVITGHEAFKKLNYTDIEKPRPNRRKGQFKKIDIDRIYTPVQHQHEARLRNLEGKAMDMGRKVTAVRVRIHLNGDFSSAGTPVTLKNAHSKKLENIIFDIDNSMGIKVVRLYKIINDGGSQNNFVLFKNEDIRSLQNGDHFLALQDATYKLGTDKFYRKRKNFTTSVSPSRYDRSKSPPPRMRNNFSNKRVLPSIGSSNQSQNDTLSPHSNATSYGGGRKSNRSKGQRNNRDYDTDEGGVFKAKRQNNAQGAHQVNDTRETRTEKPIDQREAEVVDEEEIHSKEKTTPIPPGTELNKRPSKETKQNSDNGGQSKNKIEVKKGGKSGKEVINNLSVLPPIIDEGGDKSSSENQKKGEKIDKNDGQVKDAVDKIEGKSKNGVDGTEKPKDLETNDVIEMSEKEATPMDLKSNDVRINNPPLSTTPSNGKLSPAKSLKKERVNEEADMHRIDEFDDESFNHSEQNTSGPITGDPRSSTPASQGEARRKREQEEYKAAAKIQAGARGYKARKEYQAQKEAKNRDEDARRRREQEDDAERFEEEARRRAEEDSKLKEKQLDEDKAATKIQASFKGHKARKDFKERQAVKQQVCHDKQSKNRKEIEAATQIQSGFRGYKARKEYNHRKKQARITDINDNEKKDLDNDKVGKKKMNQDEASVVIQAGFKGYKTRKEFAQRKSQEKNEKIEKEIDSKTDNEKEQNKAATQIQANFRGYKARKGYSVRKEKAKEEKARVEKESATKIQASFKGFKARKEMAERKKKEPQLPDPAPSPQANDADLDKAASKIQAGFKGYKARKEYNAKGQQ